MKTTGSTVTKYVYGNGLIGEETKGAFKTYHFDYRGSTVAITNSNGNVTDTFKYDTYGKLTGRTGTSTVIFGYNGRDGVITDDNGLIYMRARYYSPDMKRFINADVLAGDISNVVTLNRYAYANGNPVSLVDPLGLCPPKQDDYEEELPVTIRVQLQEFFTEEYMMNKGMSFALLDENVYKSQYELYEWLIKSEPRPYNIGVGQWARNVNKKLNKLDNMIGANSKFIKGVGAIGNIVDAIDVLGGVAENIEKGTDGRRIATDAVVDTSFIVLETAVSSAVAGALAGSVAPGLGTVIGALAGLGAGVGIDFYVNLKDENGKSWSDEVKEELDWVLDQFFK